LSSRSASSSSLIFPVCFFDDFLQAIDLDLFVVDADLVVEVFLGDVLRVGLVPQSFAEFCRLFDEVGERVDRNSQPPRRRGMSVLGVVEFRVGEQCLVILHKLLKLGGRLGQVVDQQVETGVVNNLAATQLARRLRLLLGRRRLHVGGNLGCFGRPFPRF
jgi:hypothetical protein